MKHIFFAMVALCTVITGLGQASIVGTWTYTTDAVKEFKIISPTHVFFVVMDAKTDTLLHAGAGRYTTNGTTYTENLKYADFAFNKAGFAFQYSVKDDTLRQDGTNKMEDGSEFTVHNVFTRVKSQNPSNGPHVGTWNQLSSSFEMPNGQKQTHTNATHIRYQVFTPTHWMRISAKNGKFENVMGGTLTAAGNKVTGDFTFTPKSFPVSTVEMIPKIEGRKMLISGTGKDAAGKVHITFDDVFEAER